MFGTGLEMVSRRRVQPGPDPTWNEVIGFTQLSYYPNHPFDIAKKYAVFYHGGAGYGGDNLWHVITSNGGGAFTDHGSFAVPAWNETSVWRTFRITGNADDSEMYFYVDGVLKKTVNTNLPASGSVLAPHYGVYYNGSRVEVDHALFFGHSRAPVYA